jgi:hypothetical protein
MRNANVYAAWHDFACLDHPTPQDETRRVDHGENE